MKTKFFAALCFAAALFTSCSKDKNDEPKVKPTPETAQIKHFGNSYAWLRFVDLCRPRNW